MSGIYIPGMEIPGSCSDCLNIGWHYVFECHLDDMEEGKRLASCPLVPVPEYKLDSDDAWKGLFGLVVLLLSDKEKFNQLIEEITHGLEKE